MKVRLETMSKIHCIIFFAVVLVFIGVFFGASFKTEEMFVYDQGNNNQEICPDSLEKAQVTGEVSPFDCQSSIIHDDGVYWQGRLEGIKVENQIVIVYGYITPNHTSQVKGKFYHFV